MRENQQSESNPMDLIELLDRNYYQDYREYWKYNLYYLPPQSELREFKFSSSLGLNTFFNSYLPDDNLPINRFQNQQIPLIQNIDPTINQNILMNMIVTSPIQTITQPQINANRGIIATPFQQSAKKKIFSIVHQVRQPLYLSIWKSQIQRLGLRPNKTKKQNRHQTTIIKTIILVFKKFLQQKDSVDDGLKKIFTKINLLSFQKLNKYHQLNCNPRLSFYEFKDLLNSRQCIQRLIQHGRQLYLNNKNNPQRYICLMQYAQRIYQAHNTPGGSIKRLQKYYPKRVYGEQQQNLENFIKSIDNKTFWTEPTIINKYERIKKSKKTKRIVKKKSQTKSKKNK